MLSATYLFSGNSHMHISYLKFCLIFCLPMRKFCYNGINKTLNSMKTLKLKLLQVRLKWKKIQKFYLYMDYLKFPYHPLNLNKSKKNKCKVSFPAYF